MDYQCALHNYCADGKTRWVPLSKAGRLSLVRVGEERLQVRIFQVNQDGDDNQYDELGLFVFFPMPMSDVSASMDISGQPGWR